MSDQPAKIQLRRGTYNEWQLKNPVLRDGEPGYESDTRRYKVGDGFTPWIGLGYVVGGGTSGDDSAAMAALEAHILSLTPHAVYDDGPDLVLLYQNAKV